jgi:hypothetical protein
MAAAYNKTRKNAMITVPIRCAIVMLSLLHCAKGTG